jgi:DNA (cytosine-5)-methyltransferase 1
VLDAFSCSGSASIGYLRAGFDEVVGVDIAEQPNYPFEFHRGDAIEFIRNHGHEFDFIHTSPPCQASCTLTKGTNQGRDYPQLIPQTRAVLAAVGVPSVIENVVGADIRRDVVLCGEMFGLGVIRHRVFELSGWSMLQPAHQRHRGYVRGWRHGVYRDGPYLAVHGEGGGKGSVAEWQTAMGIFHTDVRHEIAEAIPPAYAECIGQGVLAYLGAGKGVVAAS